MTEPLSVETDNLEKWATLQDQAAGDAGDAATTASGVGQSVWVSHGVACSPSNVMVGKAEEARKKAGDAMQQASTDLATKLRKSLNAYRATNLQAAVNIDKQVIE